MNQLIYLLQLIIYCGAFSLVYRLLLAGRTTHYFNRRFLLAAIVLPFVLPLLQMPVLGQEIPLAGAINMQEVIVGANNKITQSILPDCATILLSAYLLVTAFMLSLLVWNNLRFVSIIRKAKKIMVDNTPIYILDGMGPGSYNGHIFFPDENINPYMLHHEQAHVHHRHYLDLWVAQIAKAACWVNPFLYYLAAQLKMVHEYEADAAASRSETLSYADALLNHIFQTKQISIAHYFFHHPIKNRILMLQKQDKARRNGLIKVVAMMTIAVFSGSMIVAQTSKTIKKKTPVKTVSKSNAAIKSDEVFRNVSKMPEFNGNVSEWLSSHLVYPDKARKAGSEGRVMVEFVVSKDGHVSNLKVVHSSDIAALDNEAMRVISQMPPWIPGKEKGRNVNVYFNLPITFRLQ